MLMLMTFLNQSSVNPVGGNRKVELGSKEAKKMMRKGPSIIERATKRATISHLFCAIFSPQPC